MMMRRRRRRRRMKMKSKTWVAIWELFIQFRTEVILLTNKHSRLLHRIWYENVISSMKISFILCTAEALLWIEYDTERLPRTTRKKKWKRNNHPRDDYCLFPPYQYADPPTTRVEYGVGCGILMFGPIPMYDPLTAGGDDAALPPPPVVGNTTVNNNIDGGDDVDHPNINEQTFENMNRSALWVYYL